MCERSFVGLLVAKSLDGILEAGFFTVHFKLPSTHPSGVRLPEFQAHFGSFRALRRLEHLTLVVLKLEGSIGRTAVTRLRVALTVSRTNAYKNTEEVLREALRWVVGG